MEVDVEIARAVGEVLVGDVLEGGFGVGLDNSGVLWVTHPGKNVAVVGYRLASSGDGYEFGGSRRICNSVLKVRGDVDRDGGGRVAEAKDRAGTSASVGVGTDGGV